MKGYIQIIFLLMLSIAFWTGCGAGSTDDTTVDITRPMVSSTNPADFETGVAVNANIAATYSVEMDPATITDETFILKKGSESIEGVVTYAGLIATFSPKEDFTAHSVYSVRITAGAKDLEGNAMSADKTWEFTTGDLPDKTAPAVSSTNPFDSELNVARNRNISATFNEWMDHLTITSGTFILSDGTTPVEGVVTYTGFVATFNPSVNLAADTKYTSKITTGARDLAGNSLTAEKIWSFTTGETADNTPPIVISTDPANGVPKVFLSRNITAVFNEGMDPATISSATFILKKGVVSVPGAVTYAGDVASYNPTNDLEANTTYTATITTGARDLADNPLAVDKIWSFTTGAIPPVNPTAVKLGVSGSFVILSETKITNESVSSVTGDVGIIDKEVLLTGFAPLTMDPLTSPGDFSTSPQIDGRVYALDYGGFTPAVLNKAGEDMSIAYNDAASEARIADFTDLGAGNISGLRFCRGVYKWNSGVVISTDVYLEGGPNDVWIFQIAEGLTMSKDVKVVLVGGAQAGNIFWQTAEGVTIAASAEIAGTVLSKHSIVLTPGARANGRLLAQTYIVLHSNTVTRSSP